MGFGGALLGAVVGVAAAPFTGGLSLGLIGAGAAIGAGIEGAVDLSDANDNMETAQRVMDRANGAYEEIKKEHDEDIALYTETLDDLQNKMIVVRRVWNIGAKYLAVIQKELNLSDDEVMEISQKFFSSHGLMAQNFSTGNTDNIDAVGTLGVISGGIVGGIALEATGAAVLGTLGLETGAIVGGVALGSAAVAASFIVGPALSIFGSVKLSKSKEEIEKAWEYEADIHTTIEKMQTQMTGIRLVMNGINNLDEYHDRIARCLQSLIVAVNSIDGKSIVKKIKLNVDDKELLLAIDPNATNIKAKRNDFIFGKKLPKNVIKELKSILAVMVNILPMWQYIIEMDVIKSIEEETQKPIFNDSIIIEASKVADNSETLIEDASIPYA